MKLRNKKTGEIGYTAVLQGKAIVVMDENAIQLGSYASLAELNSEWEDAPEKPKGFWSISGDATIEHYDRLNENDHCKQIGNYFETEAEAEKAVEKLETAKRLKDKGFKITGWAIYPLPDEFLDGKRIWYNTVLRGRIDFEIPLDNSDGLDKELEHFVTDEEGGEE